MHFCCTASSGYRIRVCVQHTKEQQENQQLQAKLNQELHDKEAAIKELQLELNTAKAIPSTFVLHEQIAAIHVS